MASQAFGLMRNQQITCDRFKVLESAGVDKVGGGVKEVGGLLWPGESR